MKKIVINFLIFLDKKTKSKVIKVKFLQGKDKNKELIFDPNITTYVRIGRLKTNEVVCCDDSISRIQCT